MRIVPEQPGNASHTTADLCYIPLVTRKKSPLVYRWSRLPAGDPCFARVFAEHPGCNTGLRLDPFVTVDCDSPERVEWWERHGPPTRFQSRGNRERRTFWYRLDEDDPPIPEAHHRLALEIRTGPGQQAVIPPSTHPTGVVYEWLDLPVEAGHLDAMPTLSASELDAILAPLVGHERRRPAPGSDVPAGTWTGPGEGTPDALDELRRAREAIVCAPPQQSNFVFHRRASGVAQRVAAGELDEAYAHGVVLDAGRLREVGEVETVLARSWAHGLAHPRSEDPPLEMVTTPPKNVLVPPPYMFSSGDEPDEPIVFEPPPQSPEWHRGRCGEVRSFRRGREMILEPYICKDWLCGTCAARIRQEWKDHARWAFSLVNATGMYWTRIDPADHEKAVRSATPKGAKPLWARVTPADEILLTTRPVSRRFGWSRWVSIHRAVAGFAKLVDRATSKDQVRFATAWSKAARKRASPRRREPYRFLADTPYQLEEALERFQRAGGVSRHTRPLHESRVVHGVFPSDDPDDWWYLRAVLEGVVDPPPTASNRSRPVA